MKIIINKFLKVKISVMSKLNSIELPINKKSMIDSKYVRHVYKIEKDGIKLFYCMISGKSYLLNYESKLEDWFNVSDIKIKESKGMKLNFKIASVNNLEDFEEIKLNFK